MSEPKSCKVKVKIDFDNKSKLELDFSNLSPSVAEKIVALLMDNKL